MEEATLSARSRFVTMNRASPRGPICAFVPPGQVHDSRRSCPVRDHPCDVRRRPGACQRPAVGDPPAVQAARLDQVVPVDPLITVGTLPNGFRYYIRENRQPQARAELRLAVKAGSVLEDEDQRGMAHFVEHMAFNGTRNFPGNAVGTFMQSLGVRFGAHVNAHTSFDETVYELQIPTDNPAVIDRSLLILEDFAHNVTFDPGEIDQERGVILEEWRLGLGAGERIQNAQFPLLLKGSRYADRLPIGKPEIIRNVNHDRLKQFYTDWYRPDLMAVIAVGDFKKADVEFQIRAHFGSIPAPPSPTAATDVHGAGSAGDGLLGDHRPRGHQHAHQRDEHDGGPRADDASAPTVSTWSSSCSRRCCPRGSTRSRRRPTRRSCGRRPIATSSCAPSK